VHAGYKEKDKSCAVEQLLPFGHGCCDWQASPVVVASQEGRGGVEGFMTRWRIRRLQTVLGGRATVLERPDQARQARQDKTRQDTRQDKSGVEWSEL
jgi:hypothetical protein